MLYNLQPVTHALSTVILKYPNLVGERDAVPDFPDETMEAKIMQSINASSCTNPLMQIYVAVCEVLATTIPPFLPHEGPYMPRTHV